MQRASILILLLAAVAFVTYSIVTRDDDGGAARTDQPYSADGELLAARPEGFAPRNLIVLLLDTVRRDAVSLGDEPDAAMPHLSRLGEQGIAFREATSPAPWTVPVVASVLTGLHPSEHNCQEYTDSGPAPRLQPAITTYAEILRSAYGYQTAAFSDVPWYRGADTSLLQGFEGGSHGQGLMMRTRRLLESGFWLQDSAAILTPWVESRDPARPFFLFLHAYDAHDPYGEENHPPASLPLMSDPEERRRRIDAIGPTTDLTPAEMLALTLTSRAGRLALAEQHGPLAAHVTREYACAGYRADPQPELARALLEKYVEGARFTDRGVGLLVAFLEQQGLLENTLFVVFSDHGEAFGEHGFIGHGLQLEDELIHVPLVMTGPGPFATPQVVDESVGLIDIMPTFLDWIGVPDLEDTRGRSLLPLLRGEHPGRAILSETVVEPAMTKTDARRVLASARSDRWKFIVDYDISHGHISERLFDLSADPREQTNLLETEPELSEFPLPASFCAKVELARDRVWEVAESILARALTPYSAGVPTTQQVRPAPACREPPR